MTILIRLIVVFTDAPTEQEVEAGSGVPQVPCVSTHAKVMLGKFSTFMEAY